MSEADISKLKYEHPLVDRYASKEMNFVWSPQKKFSTWRKLWTALSETEMELGMSEITPAMIDEMKRNIDNIDFELAEKKEKEFRHDVMAHVHTFSEVCPLAKPVVHLGATSCYVGDNTDIIQLKESLELVCKKILKLLHILRNFALKHRDLATLGYTHFQPAQLTTVGKRCVLWMQDFMLDYHELSRIAHDLPMRGVKGTTGTQASFLGKTISVFFI